MNIDELKDKVQQYDAERLRLVTEISNRKRDLKRYAASMSEELKISERQKIDNLEDILEDVEYDLTVCLDQLFEKAGPDADIKEADAMFKAVLEEEKTEQLDDGKQTLAQQRDRVAQELEHYKAARNRCKEELNALNDLIEATELELDEIIADLAE